MALPEMKPVTSSMLESMGYDAATQRAFVRFNSGKLYVVEGVNASDYRDWSNASSVGTHFNRLIKPSHEISEYVL